MLRNTTIRNIIFAAISAAALSACGGGGGSSPSTELVNNATSARSVMDQIEALPAADSVTASNVAAIQQAVAAYNSLGSSQSLVSSTYTDKLNALLAAVAAAEKAATAVENQIAALPSEITKTDSVQVTAARTSYDALTDAQQTWVGNAEALSVAEATVTANTNKAAAIQAEIAALPTEISKTDSAKVTTARADLEALTDAQETWVASSSVTALETAEATVKTNQTKADAVAKQIAALPDNGLDVDTDEEIAAFTAAKKALADLSDSEETWVDSAATAKLTQVEAKTVIDSADTSLAAVNEAAPLPSAFLTLAVNNTAQQFNPQMQLRSNKALLSDQTRLIKELSVSDPANPTPTTPQDYIGLTAVGVYDLASPGNSTGKIDRIEKVSSTELRSSGNAPEVDKSSEVAYRLDADKTVLDKKWDGIYAIRTTTGVNIIIRDPAAIGWNYQTFAYYSDLNNNVQHAYQSIGTETAANAMPTSGTATYNGLTTAQYVLNDNAQQMTADVKAVVDFSKKLVRFETSSSRLHAAVNGVRQSQDAADLNMKGNASWTAGNQFTGTATTSNNLTGELNGKFYGGNAAEIGGTYGLKNSTNTAQLIGGYGAKRQ